MRSEAFGVAALVIALIGVGGFAWRLQLTPDLQADARSLASLPRSIDGFVGQDVPIDQSVERVLDAEFNLQRAYVHRSREVIWLYLGYYGTARGGRPEHTPRGCYTGAGWTIEATRSLDVEPGGPLRVNEYLVSREGERRLVHFWFRSHRRTGILGGIDQNLDRLIGRLRDGRADGALIRLSAPLDDASVIAVRGRLMSFATRLDPLIAERWPSESMATSLTQVAPARDSVPQLAFAPKR